MARDLISETQRAVRDLMDRLAGRTIRGDEWRIGDCHSQAYPAGPVAWVVCLHVGPEEAPWLPAQVTVKCFRASGALTVTAESRQDAKTKSRLGADSESLAVAAKVADRVQALMLDQGLRLDPAHAPPESPLQKRVREQREAAEAAEAEFDALKSMFGGDE